MVSAGYRFDPLFIRRLKTIFEMSDALVIGTGWSISTGYALAMNKPVAVFYEEENREKEFPDDMFYWKADSLEEIYANYKRVFNEELIITQEQIDFLDPVSGFNIKRDKAYFRNVLEISKDIWKMAGYDENRYPIGVYSAYDFYRKTGDLEKALILREAVGENFI